MIDEHVAQRPHARVTIAHAAPFADRGVVIVGRGHAQRAPVVRVRAAEEHVVTHRRLATLDRIERDVLDLRRVDAVLLVA